MENIFPIAMSWRRNCKWKLAFDLK